MILTNENGLPNLGYKFVEYQVNDEHDGLRWKDPNRFHVTGLIDSVMLGRLKRAHGHEVVYDAAELVDIAVGKAIHAGFEKALKDAPNFLTEVHLERTIEVFGREITITGTIDAIEILPGWKLKIWDLKTTSVWHDKFSDFSDWKNQLAVYSWLLAGNIGTVYCLIAKKLILSRIPDLKIAKTYEIFEWLKDHSKQSARVKSDYPDWSFSGQTFELADLDETEDYVRQRVIEFLRWEDAHIDDVPECTTRERWEKSGIWAVYALTKAGVPREKAAKLHDNEADATAHAERIGGIVEFRPGENVRCERFCKYRQYCHFGREIEK